MIFYNPFKGILVVKTNNALSYLEAECVAPQPFRNTQDGFLIGLSVNDSIAFLNTCSIRFSKISW